MMHGQKIIKLLGHLFYALNFNYLVLDKKWIEAFLFCFIKF